MLYCSTIKSIPDISKTSCTKQHSRLSQICLRCQSLDARVWSISRVWSLLIQTVMYNRNYLVLASLKSTSSCQAWFTVFRHIKTSENNVPFAPVSKKVFKSAGIRCPVAKIISTAPLLAGETICVYVLRVSDPSTL